jgi:hypothetical protein
MVVGDEHGVQARFSQSFGTVLSHIFGAQGIDLVFGDFKCLGNPYTGTPDVILMDNTSALKVVGELKVPWISKHILHTRYHDQDELRMVLAQPINYMQDLDCMYGFLSTYAETMFIRQRMINGTWTVEYSPVIHGSTSYVRSTSPLGTPIVSAKQCFLYVASLASQQGPVHNPTPKPLWVLRTNV